MIKKSLFIIALFLCFSYIFALSLPEQKDAYVNDFGAYFSPADIAYLKTLFYETWQNTTSQVFLVTVTSLEGYAPSDYATQLFTKWKIGYDDKDNGLLVLYAIKENRIWITTGYGLEGILPDSKVGRLLDETYVPLRDNNQTKEGIIKTSEALVKIIHENREEILSGEAGREDQGKREAIIWIIFILFFFILPSILRRFFKKNKKKKPSNFWESMFWFWLGSSLGRSSGNSGFSGGFSGGGFSGGFGGGGGTGGGGAGR